MYTLPQEIKTLNSMIEHLGSRHNYATVFDDYLSALVNFFTPKFQNGFGVECFRKYEEKERMVISDMIRETILVYNKMITDDKNSWYDLFGELYQHISSRTQAKSLGQFFTPVSLVDMMIKMNYQEELTGKGLRISDPSCGSGRMLIAFQGHYPGNYVFGEDLDLICCKMSLINCLFHGCEGEIVWHDTLLMDFRRAWRINPDIRQTGIPSIFEIGEKDSFLTFKNKNDEKVVDKIPVKLPSEQETKPKIISKQLTIF